MQPEQQSYESYKPRNINTDPREQQQQEAPPQEYMAGRFYDGPGQQGMGGAKIRPQRPRRRGLWFLLILLLLIVLAVDGVVNVGLGRVGALQPGSLAKSLPPHTFTVTGTPRLVINDDSGAIHIHTGGSANTVNVQVTKHATGLGANTDDMQVEYNQTGNTIDVTTHANGAFLGFKSVDLEITTPSTSDVEVHTGSGEVEINGVTGQMQAETGSGSIVANNISGDVTLRTGSGSIHANNMGGQVLLTTGSGEIEARHTALKGQSLLKTGSGSIQFEGSIDSQGSYRLETGSGSIDATLPGNSTFHLETSTGSGSVHNGFENSDVGNTPRPTLSLSTGSGSITLHKGS
jgi:hypothetical protein